MPERHDSGYQPSHAQKITLDKYHGVANGIMELNEPVADGFMRVSDMRADVVVVSRLRDSVLDYDELGPVRVAKLLRLPRIGSWSHNGLVSVMRENDAWYIGINDQGLAGQVARSNDGTEKFEDLFIDRFKVELKKGLRECLKREKLLNSGRYNASFFWTWYFFATHEVLYYPAAEVLAIAAGVNPLDVTGRVLAVYLLTHSIVNTMNLGVCGLSKVYAIIDRKMFQKQQQQQSVYSYLGADWPDPFVKHHLLELMAPPVSVDRLLRGHFYLNRHGQKLINKG